MRESRLIAFHVASTGTVKFAVNIFDGTGEFEICESGSVAVKGVIKVPEDLKKQTLNLPEPYVAESLPLSSADIYKELGLRGYDYTGIFRGIKTSDNYGRYLPMYQPTYLQTYFLRVVSYLFAY